MQYYLKCFKSYAVFTGRASRSEYWYFALFNFIACMILSILGNAIHTMVPYFIYVLAIFIPSLAVGVRRMHDVDKSGWFILIPIYSLILACTPGTSGDNRYGADPFMDTPTFDFEEKNAAV